MVERTEYVTTVDGEEVYRGSDLEAAIRSWDYHGHMAPGRPGGISVQSWGHYGTMIRDGWILQVFESGQVYLSPTLKA